MLSKAKIKWIRSLEMKKFRQVEDCFLAEGNKLVGDLLPSMHCRFLAALPVWCETHSELLKTVDECIVVTPEELERASLMLSPQEVLAVFDIPKSDTNPAIPAGCLSLALDKVQDPGNLGTIIRIADWFGIEDIFCSPDTADAYNPKVVQATMGAIGRVRIHYTELEQILRHSPVPVYGTFLDGDDLYKAELSPEGIIVMGNEGNGISDEIARLTTHRLLIPNFPEGRVCSESLNVSTATAIICGELRRRFR